MLGRLALLPLTLVCVLGVSFALAEMVPGDAALARFGHSRGATPEALAAFRHEAGLDRPPLQRFARWLGQAAVLDFGTSLSDGRPVRTRLAEALPTTLALGGLALLFAFGVGMALAVLLAFVDEKERRARPWVSGVGALFTLAYALPGAALALAALSLGAPYGRHLGALVVAAACLALPLAVRVFRHQRAALADALASPALRTAAAVGASPLRRVLRHALVLALLPALTLLGSELPLLLSGSLLVEAVFGLRGLGGLGLDAVAMRDYPLILALATLSALLVLAGTLLSDGALWLCDPRLRRRAP